MLHDEVVVARGFVPDEELVGDQGVAHRREPGLGEHRHRHRLAARLVGAPLCFFRAPHRRKREGLHQVEGHVHARRSPGVIEQKAVAVVVQPGLEVDSRKQADQGLARLVGRDARAVALLGHFRAHLQREHLELLDVGAAVGDLPGIWVDSRDVQVGARRGIDQDGELDPRLREVVSPERDLLAEIEQRAAQRRGLHGRQELARLDEARLVDRLVDLGEQAIGRRQQPLGRLRAPPGDAHVVQQHLDRLATALRRDQLLVRKLPGAVIADPEIEHVPGEADARRGARALHRGGGRGRDGAVGGKAESKSIVAARAVAGIRGQLR